MHHHYRDITDKLGEPYWWDEHGVPRYCEFDPDAGADIYASEVALLLIGCQGCGAEFKVAMSFKDWPPRRPSLADLIETDEVHYGDPPNAGCCPAGATMNSVPLRVLEFWRRHPSGDVRVPELERVIECEWQDG